MEAKQQTNSNRKFNSDANDGDNVIFSYLFNFNEITILPHY